ncbi:MAG TPA: PQQ-binding-like beta-propeller repeat protein [Herpetosiphonaceae bacterium]
MGNELNQFEQAARAQLQDELGRVSVPPRQPKPLKFGSLARWGRRAFGGVAVAAAAVLIGLMVFRGVATPTAQPGAQADRIYLISKVGGLDEPQSRRIRAVDPATGQIAWTVDITRTGALAPDAGEGGLDGKLLLDLPEIDAVLSPDGYRLYFADPGGISALDAASGQRIWHVPADATPGELMLSRTGGHPIIAVSPDGQSVYALKRQAAEGVYRIERRNAADGELVSAAERPDRGYGFGILAPAGDQVLLYLFRHDTSAGMSDNTFDLTTDAAEEIRSASAPPRITGALPAADGTALYVLDPDQLWIFDNGRDFRLESERLPGAAGRPRVGVGSAPPGIALSRARVSRGGERLLVQAAGEHGPEWWIYDTATWARVARVNDPRIAPGLRLPRGLMEFSGDTTRFYLVMDAALDASDSAEGGIWDTPAAWNDKVLLVNSQDGSAQPVIELPGEHVVRLLAGPAPGTVPAQRIGLMPPAEARAVIAERATAVMAALRDKDLARLATFVHPDVGLRFSANRTPDRSRAWAPQELPGLAGDPTVYDWGSTYSQEASPPRVAYTFDDYYQRVLYAHDYAAAPEVYYNEVSPGASATGGFPPPHGRISVEYHSPGPADDPVGWGSLVLEFEQREGVWYLRGIGHIFWSP